MGARGAWSEYPHHITESWNNPRTENSSTVELQTLVGSTLPTRTNASTHNTARSREETRAPRVDDAALDDANPTIARVAIVRRERRDDDDGDDAHLVGLLRIPRVGATDQLSVTPYAHAARAALDRAADEDPLAKGDSYASLSESHKDVFRRHSSTRTLEEKTESLEAPIVRHATVEVRLVGFDGDGVAGVRLTERDFAPYLDALRADVPHVALASPDDDDEDDGDDGRIPPVQSPQVRFTSPARPDSCAPKSPPPSTTPSNARTPRAVPWRPRPWNPRR